MSCHMQIATGEALALCYGPHDNHHLLLSYGFTIQPSNPSDRFWLDIDVELLEVGIHAYKSSCTYYDVGCLAGYLAVQLSAEQAY